MSNMQTGIGWTGGKTCVSGYCCQYSNDCKLFSRIHATGYFGLFSQRVKGTPNAFKEHVVEVQLPRQLRLQLRQETVLSPKSQRRRRQLHAFLLRQPAQLRRPLHSVANGMGSQLAMVMEYTTTSGVRTRQRQDLSVHGIGKSFLYINSLHCKSLDETHLFPCPTHAKTFVRHFLTILKWHRRLRRLLGNKLDLGRWTI